MPTAQARWRDILDVGCSVGISTLALHRHYAKKQGDTVRTVGLDLSPYMPGGSQNPRHKPGN